MSRFQQFNTIEAFNTWVASLPALTQAGQELVGGLQGDTTHDRLRSLGQWIVDNYKTYDPLLDEPGQVALNKLAALTTSVLAEGFGDVEWAINLDDPNGSNFGLPVARLRTRSRDLVHSYITVTASRQDPNFILKRRENIEKDRTSQSPAPAPAQTAPIIDGGYRATLLVAGPTEPFDAALAALAESTETSPDGTVYTTGAFKFQITTLDSTALVAEYTNALPILEKASQGIEGTPLQPLDTYSAAYEIFTTPDPGMDHFNTYALVIQAIEASHEVATTLDHATLGWA